MMKTLTALLVLLVASTANAKKPEPKQKGWFCYTVLVTDARGHHIESGACERTQDKCRSAFEGEKRANVSLDSTNVTTPQGPFCEATTKPVFSFTVFVQADGRTLEAGSPSYKLCTQLEEVMTDGFTIKSHCKVTP